VVLARVTRKAIFALNLSVGAPVWVQVKSVAVIK
jgi:ABC-type molybdate transport system ATPase subunit